MYAYLSLARCGDRPAGEYSILDPQFVEDVLENSARLDEAIVHARDYDYYL